MTVREDKRRLIRAALAYDADEVTLYCHSTDKEIKEGGSRIALKRFEEALDKLKDALSKKHGTKRYDKVLEKIGRLRSGSSVLLAAMRSASRRMKRRTW